MTNEEELMAAENTAEPQKKRRTRVKKDTDQVYSATGTTGENFDLQKRRRGRPTKAEVQAREALKAAQEAAIKKAAEEAAKAQAELAFPEETPAETEATAETPVEGPVAETTETTAEATTVTPAEEPVKKRRGRRTKEEILAAAEEAAKAMAEKKLKAAGVTETPKETAAAVAKNEENGVPEEMFGGAKAQQTENIGLLEQLQNKVNTRIDSAASADGDIWEGDPADGTDFIILNDLPVEDNVAIPYYDIFDKPQQDVMAATMEEEGTNAGAPAYNFDDVVTATGVLEVLGDGYGFLRSSDYNYLSSPDDVHLTQQQIKQYSLRTGDVVQCRVRPPRGGEKYFTMTTIEKVNGRNPYDIRDRISFENLTPLFPEEKFNLCGSHSNVSTRIVDLFAPIGKGQRSLIVAQPKTGKTILMKDIANAIAANHPEAYIMMLLIDERPEEVTDMARTVNAEVIASTFDEPADRHVKIAGLVLEKAKRMVECGHDVVIFLDSITRLARAYNTVAPASGKVLTGGVDANALQKPKRFFGAARNIEGGGSLTIIATALTDTGSKMDEVIFEEFKGTGNSELQLDRQLANKRIFPAVNLIQSSTRRDDLLLDSFIVEKMGVLRVNIADMNAQEAMTTITNVMKRSRNHMEFLMGMND